MNLVARWIMITECWLIDQIQSIINCLFWCFHQYLDGKVNYLFIKFTNKQNWRSNMFESTVTIHNMQQPTLIILLGRFFNFLRKSLKYYLQIPTFKNLSAKLGKLSRFLQFCWDSCPPPQGNTNFLFTQGGKKRVC